MGLFWSQEPNRPLGGCRHAALFCGLLRLFVQQTLMQSIANISFGNPEKLSYICTVKFKYVFFNNKLFE